MTLQQRIANADAAATLARQVAAAAHYATTNSFGRVLAKHEGHWDRVHEGYCYECQVWL